LLRETNKMVFGGNHHFHWGTGTDLNRFYVGDETLTEDEKARLMNEFPGLREEMYGKFGSSSSKDASGESDREPPYEQTPPVNS